MTENTPIALDKVCKSYTKDGTYVVKDVSLTIACGEFFCLIGPSGCGKSTVVKMIAGIENPTTGAVTKPPRIGMVFQSYALLPWLTVEDNVAFAPRMQEVDEEEIARRVKRYLHMVELEAFAKRYPRELSGGQRQRVGIARALAVESEVLLMDEPFSALDPVITDDLHQDILDIWHKTHKTIVMVSHHFEEAVFLADRIGIIKDGRLERIVPISLPRPRNESDQQFMNEVHNLREYLSSDVHGKVNKRS